MLQHFLDTLGLSLWLHRTLLWCGLKAIQPGGMCWLNGCTACLEVGALWFPLCVCGGVGVVVAWFWWFIGLFVGHFCLVVFCWVKLHVISRWITAIAWKFKSSEFLTHLFIGHPTGLFNKKKLDLIVWPEHKQFSLSASSSADWYSLWAMFWKAL